MEGEEINMVLKLHNYDFFGLFIQKALGDCPNKMH